MATKILKGSNKRVRFQARVRGLGGEMVFLGNHLTQKEAEDAESKYREDNKDALEEDRQIRIEYAKDRKSW